MGKGGEGRGRGQGWERGALRSGGWVDQALGKLCGLERYCGKVLRGRRVPTALTVRDEKTSPVLS